MDIITLLKHNAILTLVVFVALVVFFSSSVTLSMAPNSLFNWNTPVFTIGTTTVTRNDLFDMLKLLSGTAFLVAFVALLVQAVRNARSKRKR